MPHDSFSQLRKGLTELAVLKVISVQKAYVATIIDALGGTEFQTGEGTLYPLLSRLRQEKLVKYEWVESEAGPPRKYYSLTEEGQAYVQSMEAYRQQLHTTIMTLGAHNE